MRVRVHVRGVVEAEEVRRHAARRVQHHLSRFGNAIRSVGVHLADVNGPKGGVDQHCRVVIHGGGFETVSVRGEGADPKGTLDATLERAGEAVGRGLARRRELRTSAGPVPAVARSRADEASLGAPFTAPGRAPEGP